MISVKTNNEEFGYFYEMNQRMIHEGKLSEGSEIQQGLEGMEISDGGIILHERPFLYPSKKILSEHRDLTGPITGVLGTCYDSNSGRILMQVRGRDVSFPYMFHTSCAGMGRFRENPEETVKKELKEEVGIDFFSLSEKFKMYLFDKGVPQILFSFYFDSDLSGFELIEDYKGILNFREVVKGEGEVWEARPFAVQIKNLRRILNEMGDFLGPNCLEDFLKEEIL